MRGKGEGSIYRDGRGYWTAVVELPPGPNGQRRRKPIRSKSKQKVIEQLAAMKNDLRERGDLPTADQTAGQWFSYWLREVAKKSVRPNTFDGYVRVIEKYTIPVIGQVKLAKLTPAHIRRVHNHMIDDLELSSTYALLAHRAIARSLTVAVREGRIGRNPATLTDAPRKATSQQEALELGEAITVLEHVLLDPHMGARWATGLLTGARRGEVIGMEVDRVTDVIDLSWQLQRLPLTAHTGRPDVPADYEYRHLIGGLYLTRPKSSAGWRTVPLVEPLRSILDRHLEAAPPNPWGLVFTHRDRPLDPDQDSNRWRDVLAAAGVDRDVPLHGLRHTAIDLLLAAGVPEDLIPQIVGHSSRAQSRAYKTKGAVQMQRLTLALEQYSALFTPPDGTGTRPAIGE